MTKTILAALLALFVVACASEDPAAPTDNSPDNAQSSTHGETVAPGETGGICGGIAGFQCDNSSEYCKMPAGMCREVADAAGTCEPKTQMCTRDYRPVCGCDNKTYSNACTAASQGASVAYEGECKE